MVRTLEDKSLEQRTITEHILYQMNPFENPGQAYSEEEIANLGEHFVGQLTLAMPAMKVFCSQMAGGNWAREGRPILVTNYATYWDNIIKYMGGTIEEIRRDIPGIRDEGRMVSDRSMMTTIDSWKRKRRRQQLKRRLKGHHVDMVLRAYDPSGRMNVPYMEIMRLKDFERAVEKIARKVCQAMMDYEYGLADRLSRSGTSANKKRDIQDIIANLYQGRKGTLTEQDIIQAAESVTAEQYVYAFADVCDWFGIKYVIQSKGHSFKLLDYALNHLSLFGPEIGMVREKERCKKSRKGKKAVYVWTPGSVVDNHYDKPPRYKDRMVYANFVSRYLKGDFFPESFDVGFTGAKDHVRDEIGDGSHHLYELRQLEEIDHWPLPYQIMYKKLCTRGFELVTETLREQTQGMLVDSFRQAT